MENEIIDDKKRVREKIKTSEQKTFLQFVKSKIDTHTQADCYSTSTSFLSSVYLFFNIFEYSLFLLYLSIECNRYTLAFVVVVIIILNNIRLLFKLFFRFSW